MGGADGRNVADLLGNQLDTDPSLNARYMPPSDLAAAAAVRAIRTPPAALVFPAGSPGIGPGRRGVPPSPFAPVPLTRNHKEEP